jgi:hypothetical protein
MTDIEKIILDEMALMRKDIRRLLEFRWKFAAILIFITVCINVYSEYSRAVKYEKFDRLSDKVLNLTSSTPLQDNNFRR